MDGTSKLINLLESISIETNQFRGIATVGTNPGTPQEPQYWMAGEVGTYAHFNGLVVSGQLAFLVWDGSAWSKYETNIEMADYFTKNELASPGKNLFDKTTITAGSYVSGASGELGENVNYLASDYMPVMPGTSYIISGYNSTNHMAWYNTAKEFISGYDGAGMVQISPTGAAFARISTNTALLDITQFENGIVATVYADYELQLIMPAKDESVTLLKLAADVFAHFYQKSVKIQAEDCDFGVIKFNRIAMPSIQYFMANYENNIYHQAICERWMPHNYFVRIESSLFSNRSKVSRITPFGSIPTVNANLYDLDFSVVMSKAFTMFAYWDSVNDGSKVVHAIGDSLTYNASYLAKVREICPDLSFSGMRVPYGDSGISVEGRGGWTLDAYFTRITGSSIESFSPYLQPSGAYKYYGDTSFWKEVALGTNGYGLNGFSTICAEIGFSSSTGLKITPATNDVMYNSANSRYEVYNGSAWVVISEETLAFTFNFMKYRSVWNIAQPDFVTILLGTNDFNSVLPANLQSFFDVWKIQFGALVTSIHADNANCKIALCLPPSVWGGDNDSVDSDTFNAKYNAAMWNARKLLIDYFDNRTDEYIYVVDTGSAIDPVYGFTLAAGEKPFAEYAGSETIKMQGNNPHPSTEGYYQMGVRLAGFIQARRLHE